MKKDNNYIFGAGRGIAVPIDTQLLQLLKNNNGSTVALDLSYQELNVSDIQALIESLRGNTHLTTLNLTGNPIGDEGVIILAHHLTFSSLILTGTGIEQAGVIALSKHPGLTSLNLSQNKIDDAGIKELAKNTKIKTLNLCGNKITSVGATALARNKTLRSLNLMENFVGDAGARSLAQNQTLIYLNLGINQITDTGVIPFASNSTLTVLILHRNQIQKEGAKALARNSSLLELDISYNMVEAEGAIYLSQNTTLTALSLARNFIDNVGIGSLMTNSTLRKLDLSYNQINDEGGAAIADNKTLEELDLSYNLLDFSTAQILAKHPNLRKLALSYNVMGNEGTIVLAESATLESLLLTGNQVGLSGAEALARNKKLKTLALSTNLVGNAGAVALSKNESLEELSLSYNQIGDEGAMALSQNRMLKVLNLNYNYIQGKGKEALMQNKGLKSLSISHEQPPEFTPQNINTLFLLAHDFLCILGKDGSIQFFNPAFARTLGYQDEELLSKPLQDLLHPEDRAVTHTPTGQLGKFPVVLPAYRYACKNGSYRWIQWSSQFKYGRIYVIGTDVTEQRNSEIRLVHVEREKVEAFVKRQTDFITHLCHEIRNPLTGIYGSLEALEEEVGSLEALVIEQSFVLSTTVLDKAKQTCVLIKARLSDMKMCAEYEETILNENLDIVKIVESKLEVSNEAIDIKKELREVFHMLKTKADRKGLILNLYLPEEALAIKGDRLRIKQIVMNLINNAIKFTEKGSIDIFLLIKSRTTSETQLEINVKDTGIGLTKEELSKLFERFSQASASVQGEYGGSGLGLLIAKHLAILMGGNISVESEKGKGSTFRCVIWCENLKAEPQEKIKSELSLEASLLVPSLPQVPRKPKILIVDDVTINRKLLGNILQRAGYSYLEASNGEEAIKQFTANPGIDIIFMDIVMPGIDGMEATRTIRRIEKERDLSNVLIIGLSGNALESQKEEALQAGMNIYITKPYKKDEILKQILAWKLSTAKESASLSSSMPTQREAEAPKEILYAFEDRAPPSRTTAKETLETKLPGKVPAKLPD